MMTLIDLQVKLNESITGPGDLIKEEILAISQNLDKYIVIQQRKKLLKLMEHAE